MKQMIYKLWLFVGFCLWGLQGIWADGLTPEQKKFQSNLYQFLKEEGFSPEIDPEDNSVTFREDDELFWLLVSDSNPYYIEFHKSGFKCTDADLNVVRRAVNEGNLKVHCAKAMFSGETVSLAVEMYCHSPEEFRYVFYKSKEELLKLEKTVLNYYNENEGSNHLTHVSSGTAINKFFPVYGFTVGQSTVKQMKAQDYIVKETDSGAKHCDVKGLTFWDFDKDKVFESIYMTDSSYMPDKWVSLGLTWESSYNQILKLFKGMGFSINIEEKPETKKFSGRKTLSAKVIAVSADGALQFKFEFDYGNENGEGYSLNSPGSLYSIDIEALK